MQKRFFYWIVAAFVVIFTDIFVVATMFFPDFFSENNKEILHGLPLYHLEKCVLDWQNDPHITDREKQKILNIYRKKLLKNDSQFRNGVFWGTYYRTQLDLYLKYKKYDKIKILASEYLKVLEYNKVKSFSEELDLLSFYQDQIILYGSINDRKNVLKYVKNHVKYLEKVKKKYAGKKEEEYEEIFYVLQHNFLSSEAIAFFRMKDYKKNIAVTKQLIQMNGSEKWRKRFRENNMRNFLSLMRSYEKLHNTEKMILYAKKNIEEGRKYKTMYLNCYEYIIEHLYKKGKYKESSALCKEVVFTDKNWKFYPEKDCTYTIFFSCCGIRGLLKSNQHGAINDFLSVIKKNYHNLRLSNRIRLFFFLLQHDLFYDFFSLLSGKKFRAVKG